MGSVRAVTGKTFFIGGIYSKREKGGEKNGSRPARRHNGSTVAGKKICGDLSLPLNTFKKLMKQFRE